MLVTVVVSKEQKNYDFFPLTVDFIEKMYAVGRIPGGYLKREAKPSDKATLTARMIDRPIRPELPRRFPQRGPHRRYLARSRPEPVRLHLRHGRFPGRARRRAPFDGPAPCVRIGRNVETGEFIVNPTYEERETCDLELDHGWLQRLHLYGRGRRPGGFRGRHARRHEVWPGGHRRLPLRDSGGVLGRVGRSLLVAQGISRWTCPSASIAERVFAHYDEMAAALRDADKLSRIGKVEALKESIKAETLPRRSRPLGARDPRRLKALEKKAMRTMVIETGERVDGRAADEIRPLMVKASYLPLVHGSGLFQRGQTQVLSVLSLGMLNEGQRLDTIEPTEGKRYMHHYNFPPFCTGETGRMGSPKRREIGHGTLAERALLPVLPDENEFPYAIRVVSEIMESNGSSSMASTCGSTLALMDGGVPIKAPVSGIAMGLIQEEGDDSSFCPTFRVSRTSWATWTLRSPVPPKGITALQMDNKATGLTFDILGRALQQAKEGRAFILQNMLDVIPEPRHTTRSTAPRIDSIQVPTDKIRDVIGSGGKVIRGIQDETGASVDIQEDGTVFVGGTGESVDQAVERIKLIIKVPEPGEEYTGRVVSIQPFGAFVNLLPGKDGLLHISRVAKGRVEKVEDVLNVGDEVKVVVIEVDDRGKISLDRLDKPEAPARAEGASEGDGEHFQRRERPRRERSERSDRPRRPGDNGGRKPRRHHDAE